MKGRPRSMSGLSSASVDVFDDFAVGYGFVQVGLVAGRAPVEGNAYSVSLVRCGLEENRPYGVDDVLVLGGEVILIGGW